MRLASRLFATSTCALLLTTSAALASVDFGAASPHRWALLAIGETDLDIGSGQVLGELADVGVVAIGDAAVVKSFVNGTLVMNTGGKLNRSDDVIVGGVQQDAAGDADLQQAASDAVAAAAAASALAATDPTASIGNATGTIVGGPGVNVLHVTDFQLTNGASLTLSAPAGACFVINVSGTFHMADGSEVILDGGLTHFDVLVNVEGPGVKVDIIKTDTMFRGVLLAVEREIMVVKGNVVGTLISGGGKLTVHSGATVENSECPGCPVPAEPTTWGTIKNGYR